MQHTSTLIYTRMSQDRSGDGAGIARQREACEEKARQLGWQVAGVLSDNDVSAYSGKRRPAYEELLRRLEAGDANAVIAWHEDRLHRSPLELEHYIDVCQPRNIDTEFVQSGRLDLRTASGRMTARIRGAVAREEVEHKSERERAKRRRIAESGGRHKAGRVYGWDDDGMTIREPEAAIVREIAGRLLAGEPQTRIAASLNARGERTAHGKVWTGIGVKKIGLRASNAAIRTHYEREYDGNWQAIISKDIYRQLAAVMKSRDSRRWKRGAGRRYLLTGFAVCGVCGNTLAVGAARSNAKSAYRCDGRKSHSYERVGCGKISRHVAPLEWMIQEEVLYRLESDKLLDVVNRSHGSEELRELTRQADMQRARIGDLVEDYATGVLTRNELTQAKEIAEHNLSVVERQINTLTYRSALSMDDMTAGIRQKWEGANLEWKRAVIDLLIDKVIVQPYPSNGFRYEWFGPERQWKFNPDLIEVYWKA
ncbi:MAG: recombinase family protein [Ornithinimicrobium sp.]